MTSIKKKPLRQASKKAAKRPAASRRKRTTAIGTRRTVKTRNSEKLISLVLGIGTDACQMARAINTGRYARARVQRRQIIAKLQKLDL